MFLYFYLFMHVFQLFVGIVMVSVYLILLLFPPAEQSPIKERRHSRAPRRPSQDWSDSEESVQSEDLTALLAEYNMLEVEEPPECK